MSYFVKGCAVVALRDLECGLERGLDARRPETDTRMNKAGKEGDTHEFKWSVGCVYSIMGRSVGMHACVLDDDLSIRQLRVKVKSKHLQLILGRVID